MGPPTQGQVSVLAGEARVVVDRGDPDAGGPVCHHSHFPTPQEGGMTQRGLGAKSTQHIRFFQCAARGPEHPFRGRPSRHHSPNPHFKWETEAGQQCYMPQCSQQGQDRGCEKADIQAPEVLWVECPVEHP